MTANPIEDAYEAFCAAVSTALQRAMFSSDDNKVRIDPPEDIEPDGDESHLITLAAIVQGDTKPIRVFMGGANPRYTVERSVTVELAAASPERSDRDEAMNAAVSALCSLPGADETLGGAAEWCEVEDMQSGDLPPNGVKRIVAFILRVRAGDPLGLTPA